ncbi:MAG: hypothetical protein GX362_02665 [Methanosarcinaceae archaeon]|nr:hypothetical protein [Methanosarcinaceae archaeon]
MDNNEDVKKIAHYLEIGGTMLADHCNTCGAPLFRLKGNVLCPLCTNAEPEVPEVMEVIEDATYPPTVRTNYKPDIKKKKELDFIERKILPTERRNGGEIQKHKKDKYSRQQKAEKTYRAYPAYPDEEELRLLILMKLIEIAENNINEEDPRRIEESFEIIDLGIDLIRKIERYDYE